MDIYQAASILGVDGSSSERDLKKSWRNYAKMYHPDRNSSPNAEDMFKRVSSAFQLLAGGGLSILKLGKSLRTDSSRQSMMISGPYVPPVRTTRVNDWYWEEQQWLEGEFGHFGYWNRSGIKRR